MSFSEAQKKVRQTQKFLPQKCFCEKDARVAFARFLTRKKIHELLEILPVIDPKLFATDGSIALPQKDGELKALVVMQSFNYLPMQHTYMLLTEARRCLGIGSYFLVCSIHPGRTWKEKLRTQLAKVSKKFQALDLEHYFSPEDWRIQEKYFFRDSGVVVQALILERVDEPFTHEKA